MNKVLITLLILVGVGLVTACQHKVQLEAPDKPIEINMNLNIDHRVRVEVEKDLEKSMEKNSSIF